MKPLKFIFVTALVLTILLVAVVPCFAIETKLEINNIVGYNRFFIGTSATVNFISVSNEYIYHATDVLYSYSGLYKDGGASGLLYEGHRYLVSFLVKSNSQTYNSQFLVYNGSSYIITRNFTISPDDYVLKSFFITPSTDASIIRLWGFQTSDDDYIFFKNFNIIDVSDYTDFTIDTLDDYSLSLNNYIPSGIYYLSKPFQPYIDFHKNVLSGSFLWIQDLSQNYNVPFIFFVAIISILMFIFLVVFMIKRFLRGR